MSIDITSANEHDGKIGIRVICDTKIKYNFDIVVADKGFRGKCVDYVNDVLGKVIHVGNKIGRHSRNVVERVFGWFTHYNRLNKCYGFNIYLVYLANYSVRFIIASSILFSNLNIFSIKLLMFVVFVIFLIKIK